MPISQHSMQNRFHIRRHNAFRARRATHTRIGLYPRALMFLLATFAVCALAQAVQLNILLADAASVRESVAVLREERELILSEYKSGLPEPEIYINS